MRRACMPELEIVTAQAKFEYWHMWHGGSAFGLRSGQN